MILNGIFGTIEMPTSIQNYNAKAGSDIGIILFFSNLVKIFTIAMGFYVLYNFIMAGFLYITGAGDSGAHGKVKEKLTWSVVGLIVIVAAYTITAIIGAIFFGDANFILSPEIIGV